MKTYLLNDLNMNGFDNLVTLLDCEIRINDELNSIHFPIGKKRKVLVDALLYSGLNEHRFIEFETNENGKLDFNNFRYVEVAKVIIDHANNIVKNEPNYLENSILPDSIINKIKNS